MSILFEELKNVVGAEGFLTGSDIGFRYTQDLWTGQSRGMPALVLRPRTTGEVSTLLRLCDQAGQAVVPQGGMTGLVSGGVPSSDEVVLSLERMCAIEEVDEYTSTMTVQSGVILQTVQERAESLGLLFPLDLGARGSCTIGGCIATNAGGNRVLLYGMMRELVLGLEVVLADGTVLAGLHKLPKNNAGYDLRQLFIGTEGTLGVVTRAVLRLRPKPSSQRVAFCALRSFAGAVGLLQAMRAELPGMLSAFEVMWSTACELVFECDESTPSPFSQKYPLYVLLECSGADSQADSARLLSALDRASPLIADVVVAQNAHENQRLWRIRERIPEVVLKMQPLFGFDISLSTGQIEPYLAEVSAHLRKHWPRMRLVPFGHLGDGNIHIAVLTGETTRSAKHAVDSIVYETLRGYNGSISAEHGIGLEKRPYLSMCRTPEEIAVMRRLKAALDPRGTLNPGRIFDQDSQPQSTRLVEFADQQSERL